MAKTKELRLDIPDDLARWLMRRAKASTTSIAAQVRQILMAEKAKEKAGG